MDAQNNGSTPHPLNLGHFDQNNPLSLYSKMGAHWSKRFIDRLGEIPDCMEILTDEFLLKEHLDKVHKYRPTGTDHRYRLQLWLEYENSIKLERPMIMANVYNLVGPESTFHNLVMKDARRCAWMLCKPVAYDAHMREMLNMGLIRLRSYLEKDAMTSGKDGKPDLKLMKLQLEITRMADLRQHGAPTQKIQAIELKGTIGPGGQIQALGDELDMKALEQRKKELEMRRRAAEGRGVRGGAALPIQEAEVVTEDAGGEVKRD
jgi:hypothetical protein